MYAVCTCSLISLEKDVKILNLVILMVFSVLFKNRWLDRSKQGAMMVSGAKQGQGDSSVGIRDWTKAFIQGSLQRGRTDDATVIFQLNSDWSHSCWIWEIGNFLEDKSDTRWQLRACRAAQFFSDNNCFTPGGTDIEAYTSSWCLTVSWVPWSNLTGDLKSLIFKLPRLSFPFNHVSVKATMEAGCQSYYAMSIHFQGSPSVLP